MSEFTQGEKMTVALMNQKTVYVGAAAPSAKYDGQVWVCTSSDPPLVKVYDTTNTQWMEHHQIIYETRNSGQFPATTPILNGAVAVVYDQQQSSATMYARAGGSWRNMGGALARTYPLGYASHVGAIDADTTGRLASGEEYPIISAYVTVNTSGDYVVGALGGVITPVAGTPYIRLYINNILVGAKRILTEEEIYLISGIVAPSDDHLRAVGCVYAKDSGNKATTDGMSLMLLPVTT